jgi:uncharacterized membrane protein
LDPVVSIALLWTAFTATHVGLSSVSLRPRLVTVLGAKGFLGAYSAVALAIFVPLVLIYLGERHAGVWWWSVAGGPVARGLLYALMTLALVLVVEGITAPSPASLGAGPAAQDAATRVRGALRVTRHPLALGVGLLMALHLIPNASSVDLAFFGGFVLFTLLAAWHQDTRKQQTEGEAFRAFLRATRFVPFSGRASLVGLREIPWRSWAIAVAAALGLRWLHPTGIWPH